MPLLQLEDDPRKLADIFPPARAAPRHSGYLPRMPRLLRVPYRDGACCHQEYPVISTANITMQFGAKPLFENISVKFGDGNRYGLIGANGCGKSTFMKILDGSLVPSAGNVSITPNERVGRLHQDQFAFEKFSVVDTVIMGHRELWEVKQSGPYLRAARDVRGRRHESRRARDPVRGNGRLYRREPGG